MLKKYAIIVLTVLAAVLFAPSLTAYAASQYEGPAIQIGDAPAPTSAPTQKPTTAPTSAPTQKPTTAPTSAPTQKPTTAPTSAPTQKPTTAPTSAPTQKPTTAPTSAPTQKPTSAPTQEPTTEPTSIPTTGPTESAEPTASTEPIETTEPTTTPELVPTTEPTSEVIPTTEPEETPKPIDRKPAPEDDQDSEDDADITKYVPFAENVPVNEKEELILDENTDTYDVEGSTMQYLMLRASKVKSKSIKLCWKKVKGADGYIIYGNKCGKKMKKITTIKKGSTTSYTAKKLKKGTYYKYMVVAYKNTSAGKKVITTSKSVHIATTGGTRGNPVSLKIKKTKLTINQGKTKKIKASYKSKKRVVTHIAKYRYESLDENVATVDEKGIVTAVSEGQTKILVYTQNGLCKKVTVTVK